MGKKKSVTVYLDGKAMVVPVTVDCCYAARGALGMARGTAVGYEADRVPLRLRGGHTFTEGERYVLVPFVEFVGLSDPSAARREPWQADPDAWKQP